MSPSRKTVRCEFCFRRERGHDSVQTDPDEFDRRARATRGNPHAPAQSSSLRAFSKAQGATEELFPAVFLSSFATSRYILGLIKAP